VHREFVEEHVQRAVDVGDAVVAQAEQVGVSHVVRRDLELDQLVDALEQVHQGAVLRGESVDDVCAEQVDVAHRVVPPVAGRRTLDDVPGLPRDALEQLVHGPGAEQLECLY